MAGTSHPDNVRGRATRSPGQSPMGILRAYRGILGDIPISLSALRRISKTVVLKSFNRADYRRWTNPASFEGWWETRTQKVAALIPKGSRVIEFGAGSRWLESYLDPHCSYIPSDLVDRGPGTIICDLNQRPLPDLRSIQPDVAVFIGVLEYIKDLPFLVEWLSQQVSLCVASYDYATTRPETLRRALEVLHRAYNGYMSTYSEDELVELFNRWGFSCVQKDTWNDQRLFLFGKNHRG